MKKVNRLEKHYLWHIRRINKLLDRFPKWNLSKDIPNHEMTYEEFNKIKQQVYDGGGEVEKEYIFLMNAREGFVQKLENYYPEVQYVNRLMTHSWGQKVVRFYDPDGNLIEVGTPM